MQSVKQCLNFAYQGVTHVILRDFTNYYHYQEDLAKQFYIISSEENIEPPSLWQRFSECAFSVANNVEPKNKSEGIDVHVFGDIYTQPINNSDDPEPIKKENHLQSENKLDNNFQTTDEIETDHQVIHNMEENVKVQGILATTNNESNKILVNQNSKSLKVELDQVNKSGKENLAGFPYEETFCQKLKVIDHDRKEFDINDCHFCLKQLEHVRLSENLATGETVPELFLSTTPTRTSDENDNVESLKNNSDIGLEDALFEKLNISSCKSCEDVPDLLLIEPLTQLNVQNDENLETLENTVTAEASTSADLTSVNFLEDAFKSLREMDGLLDGFSDIDSDCLNDELIRELLAEIQHKSVNTQEIVGEPTSMTAVSECDCTRTHTCLQVSHFDEEEELLTSRQLTCVETGSVSDWLYIPACCLQTVDVDDTSGSTSVELDEAETKTNTQHIQDYEHIQKALYITQWLDNMEQSSKFYGSGDVSGSN